MEQYYSISLKPKEISKKEWDCFIEMMFEIADSFTLTAKNKNDSELQTLIKYQTNFDCDNASFKSLQHIRRRNAHYCMYICNRNTKLFFKNYCSYTDFENNFEDLAFFQNRKAIYISISHEEYYDFDLFGTGVDLIEKAEEYGISHCFNVFE